MAYCVNCGKKIEETDKFCKECGTPVTPAEQSKQQAPPARETARDTKTRDRYFRNPEVRSGLHRAARITAYSFAIAWDLFLIIFFNFYSDLIAYYHAEPGVATLTRYPLVTSDFSIWQPIVTTALIIAIIGYVIMIIVDSYPVRQFIRIAIDVLAIWAIASLIVIFPFDFSPIPVADVADILRWTLPLVLGLTIFGISMGIIVRIIKLIVYAVKGAPES
jgi:hypothetical protein